MRRPAAAVLILIASTALVSGAACSRSEAPSESPDTMGMITGSITYLKRVQVPTDAEYTIELREKANSS